MGKYRPEKTPYLETFHTVELFVIAHTQKEEDKKDLANFLLLRLQKSLSDLFTSTKRLEAASEKI